MKSQRSTRIGAVQYLRNRFLLTVVILFVLGGTSLAWMGQQGPAPVINAAACNYDLGSGSLMIKGENFESGAAVTLTNAAGAVAHGRIKTKSSGKIVVTAVDSGAMTGGVDVTVANPDGGVSLPVHLEIIAAVDPNALTVSDVKTVIAQAAAQAKVRGLKAHICVVDREGNVLAIFQMAGAPATTLVGVKPQIGPCADCGLEGLSVPSSAAAWSKAGTGAFLSSQGMAFSTRTASFIVQQHFPPGVDFTSSGPLFGVQFSQLLCSDVNPRLPLGLSADPGGVPLYKNGQLAGGVGVEGDGTYTAVLDPNAGDQPVEEQVAIAATRGFEAPSDITGDKIIVNGLRFPFVNTPMPAAASITPFDSLAGQLVPPLPGLPAVVQAGFPSAFQFVTVNGVKGRVRIPANLAPPSFPLANISTAAFNFFPAQGSADLSPNDVLTLLLQAARQANITRAAIRMPLGSAAEVNITVCDTAGNILGIFSTPDAPMFGFDVSAQKARTAAFYSSASAGQQLSSTGFGRYRTAASADGLGLSGSTAFTDRAGGFLSRPFFPDGIDDTPHGPFSKDINIWSPFNDGLQLDLLLAHFSALLNGQLLTPCTPIAAPNGIQIFPGSVPIYRNGKLIGGLGISGDGVDQDDIIATMGSSGFEAPDAIRSDQVFVRGVRLPYTKFPRHPDLP